LRRPFRAALVIALCAHASIAIAFVRARPGNAAAPAPAPASLGSEEREVSVVDSPAEGESEPIGAVRAFEPRKHVVWARAVVDHLPSVAPAEAGAGANAEANAEANTEANAEANTEANANANASVALVREALPVLDLSLPARAYARAAATVPDRASGASRGGTAIDSVRAALDDHDRAIGLGTDSALVAAIRHAALGSRVPVKSSAVLWTTAGADGSLVDAEATNASSDIEAWNEVAAEVVRAMKGQRVRAVLGARGARLSFRVESLVRQGAGNAVAPSVRVGTPLYRCMEACTASGNIDPSDALLNAASRPERFVDVRALSSTRVD
jgi:hypothetical protein